MNKITIILTGVIIAGVQFAWPATLTLQNGLNGYTGCYDTYSKINSGTEGTINELGVVDAFTSC